MSNSNQRKLRKASELLDKLLELQALKDKNKQTEKEKQKVTSASLSREDNLHS